ncbi:MAG: glutamate-5-semialdehyde dehydrogenase [Clostridia bacterium]|nr:glutamate-5-semialdehyde dehydrogenase [Clostridia bacterium]
MTETLQLLGRARAAAAAIATANTKTKDLALNNVAGALCRASAEILRANAADVEQAQGHISDTMIDRLTLTPARIAGMAEGLRQVAALPDPVGVCYERIERPNGLLIEKLAVPLGVIGIIYESRPNVTSDAAALCVKSGNACVLRVGKEAWRSAHAIVSALREGLSMVGLPEDAVVLVEDTSRESANEMMRAVGYIDLLIPRGGAGLIRACVDNAIVPCIQTGTGVCHIYVDAAANLEMALDIIENAKTSRPSVCNAAETCLVHAAVAEAFLPRLRERLIAKRQQDGLVPVELRTDAAANACIGGTPADENDFAVEHLDYILGVKVVSGVQEAMAHIQRFGTGHSECIVTEDEKTAALFVSCVDCAAVYVNASTRFTDGGEFGLGCEMGISTQKLHARGPMGLKELTSYKYVIHGTGQIR